MKKVSNVDKLTGIFHVTGDHDTGKTTFALEAATDPARIIFLDDDVKGKTTIAQLQADGVEFGKYINLLDEFSGLTEVPRHSKGLEIIDSIKKGQYDVLIWDTFTRYEKSFHSYVVKNPGKFRTKWNPRGDYKGGQQWQEAHAYEARFLNELEDKIPMIVLVTHLKDDYLGDVKSGKKIPAHGKALNKVCRFRIWLRHNPTSSTPIGLVLKRLDMKKKTEKGLRTTLVLPRKLTPQEDEYSLWDTIYRYIENPIGRREPLPEEIPDDFELSILDGILTEDQKLVLEAAIQGYERGKDVELELTNVAVKRARELSEDGLSVPKITRQLLMEIEAGELVTGNVDEIDMPTVAEWIG